MNLYPFESKYFFPLHPTHRASMRKVIFTLVLLTLVLTASYFFIPAVTGMKGIAHYLPLHMLLETVSVVIAMLVFAVGWNAYSSRLPGNIVMLAAVFMGIGLLDFTHLLSFEGMPDFVTPSGAEKAIHFWLAGRSLAAVALFVFAISPWRPFASGATRYLLLVSVLALVAAIHWLFLFNPALLPETYHPDHGLTVLKINSEYLLIALNLVTALLLWLRMQRPQPFYIAGLFAAVCIMAMSEFFFTLYADVTDLFNLLGHIYKLIAYLFIYRVVFVSTIERPYLQLNASQNRLQATIAAIPDLLFEVGLDGRYYDYHSKTRQTDSAFLGQTMQETLPPDVVKAGLSALQQANETGASKGAYELVLPTGRHWFEFSVSKKAVEAGEEPRFIVLSRDVTDRIMSERSLKKSEEKFRTIIEEIPLSIALNNSQGNITYVNRAFTEALGYTAEDIPTLDAWWPLAYPDAAYRQWVIQTWQKHMQEARQTGAAFVPMELTIRGKDNSVRTFTVSAAMLDENLAETHLVTLYDITDRKLAEQQLRESKQLLENIIDNIPNMIFLKRASDLRFLLLNRTGEAVFGHNRDDVLGRSDYDFFPKAQADFFTEKDRDVLEQQGLVNIPEELIETPHGTRILHTKKLTLRDEQGQPQYLLGISEDITERRQIETALRESEKFLSESQSIANLGSYALDIRTGTWKSSDVLDRLFGIDETYERTVEGWEMLIHPDDRMMMEQYLFSEIIGEGKPFDKEYRIIRRNDQAERWVQGLGKVTFDTEGSPVEMKGTIQDITERKEAQDTLHRLSLAVEQSPSSIVITDLDANIEYVNAAFTKVTGYTLDEVLAKNPNIMHSGKVSKATYDDMWAHLTSGETWHGELINKRKDQSEYIESVVISPVRQADGRVTNYLAIKEDITEKKRAEERIENLAHFDQLTGLPNRTTLNDRINYLINIAKRNKKPLVVMFLDLDHFKNINDTLGHSIGDQLLKETAKRLKAAIREEDTVSRLGGDEFIIVFPDTDANGAMHVATKLMEAVSNPCLIEQHELIVTSSIGIAIYPDDGEDFETLSKNADTAMYRVKQENRNNFRFFTQEMQVHSVRNLQLGNALRLALSRRELQVHYQPQVAMQDGRVIGAEALLRWHHPEFGMVSPAEFIPIAEDNGQIIPIGEWVLRTAVRQMKTWIESGLPPMVIAVNLSAVQFHQSGLTELVTRILDEEKLPHEYLELELTEAVAMKNPQAAIAVMDDLFAQGVRMSIDDFGTGYSSLSYLKRFKVYKLKIDQSFVRDITHDPEDKAIVSAIITMATELGMHTIAEGVETSEQLAFLRLKGCDEVQGYYFSKPLPSEQFAAFVKESLRLSL